jgi:hypothetical protein
MSSLSFYTSQPFFSFFVYGYTKGYKWLAELLFK